MYQDIFLYEVEWCNKIYCTIMFTIRRLSYLLFAYLKTFLLEFPVFFKDKPYKKWCNKASCDNHRCYINLFLYHLSIKFLNITIFLYKILYWSLYCLFDVTEYYFFIKQTFLVLLSFSIKENHIRDTRALDKHVSTEYFSAKLWLWYKVLSIMWILRTVTTTIKLILNKLFNIIVCIHSKTIRRRLLSKPFLFRFRKKYVCKNKCIIWVIFTRLSHDLFIGNGKGKCKQICTLVSRISGFNIEWKVIK